MPRYAYTTHAKSGVRIVDIDEDTAAVNDAANVLEAWGYEVFARNLRGIAKA